MQVLMPSVRLLLSESRAVRYYTLYFSNVLSNVLPFGRKYPEQTPLVTFYTGYYSSDSSYPKPGRLGKGK